MGSPNRVADTGAEILIAEDSPTQAEQLRHLLEGRGYKVTVAANGKEALAAVHKRKPTILISDVVMPEVDGYALCKAIKTDEALKDILVVLVTALSSPHDVISGLQCGADNFIRKPYDERYLLSRIEYILVNRKLRERERTQLGVEIELAGRKHFITSERQQILDMLISTYEEAVSLNEELKVRQEALQRSSQFLSGLYQIAEGLNQATTEQEVAEKALERAMELPGLQAGWISLRVGESGFRLAAATGLPPALMEPGAFDGDCLCRRKLLSGELDQVANILECERLQKAKGDARGLRYHTSVPLWIGDRTLGVMNLAGPQQGLFRDEDLNILYGVGNQAAVALERARLHEDLQKKLEDLARANALLQARERDLELKTQELEAFAYSVSHDLKAPLRGMGGFAQMIQEDHADRLDEKGRHYLDRIRESAQRMGVLIDDLLQYSRVERRTMRWEQVDLERLVQDLIADRQVEIEARGVRVEVALPFREILGEREGLRHALANLLDNALKFSRKVAHPTITIRGEVRATERVLSVADNGIGFNSKDREKAFAIFQRLHSQEEYEGTGIGLAIVRRVVERHGGRAWAESEPGKGATFYLAIPTRNGGLPA